MGSISAPRSSHSKATPLENHGTQFTILFVFICSGPRGVEQVTQFLRLARDCQIVDDCQIVNEGQGCASMDRGLPGRSPGSAARRPKRFVKRSLGQATVNLAFASVVQRRTKVPTQYDLPGILVIWIFGFSRLCLCLDHTIHYWSDRVYHPPNQAMMDDAASFSFSRRFVSFKSHKISSSSN